MNGFQDPCKSEGIVQLKIEKLSQFAQEEPLSIRQSDVIYVRGLPWKIYVKIMENNHAKQVELRQRFLSYYLECRPEDAGPVWKCPFSATLKVLAQKEGKENYVYKFNKFDARHKSWHSFKFEDLMNPELGWYDEATDSIILEVQIAANAPLGVKNMPDNDYNTKYTMRTEHSLFVHLKDDSSCHTSSMSIEDKLWSFTYSLQNDSLNLRILMHQSDSSKTIAEVIFWYWSDTEIVILKKLIHSFTAMVNIVDSGMKSSKISVPTNDATPVNKKFNIVIRLLEERIASEENSLESYFGKYEGVETVTLCVRGHNSEEASFVVPKLNLVQASPFFQRMFANEMTEKSTGKVEIEATDAEELANFLKAISPKQEPPNPSNVFALLKLAHLYQFQSLVDRCERHLMNCIEIPLIHLFTCANFYGLKKLKNNLMVSLDGTGLFKLLQPVEPNLGILLNEIRKKIE